MTRFSFSQSSRRGRQDKIGKQQRAFGPNASKAGNLFHTGVVGQLLFDGFCTATRTICPGGPTSSRSIILSKFLGDGGSVKFYLILIKVAVSASFGGSLVVET